MMILLHFHLQLQYNNNYYYEFHIYSNDCLFGGVGFIFCVLTKVLWLISPTGTSKRLVHAEIALSLVAFLGFVTRIVNCLCYIVCLFRGFSSNAVCTLA